MRLEEKKMNKIIVTTLALLFVAIPVSAKHVHLEKEYQEAWCTAHNGIMEYELPDKTRIDCVSAYATEFDFSYKVYEAIGQSLYYSAMINKPPAVVLIMENPDRSREQKYLDRLNVVAKKHGITVFIMTPADLEQMNLKK